MEVDRVCAGDANGVPLPLAPPLAPCTGDMFGLTGAAAAWPTGTAGGPSSKKVAG